MPQRHAAALIAAIILTVTFPAFSFAQESVATISRYQGTGGIIQRAGQSLPVSAGLAVSSGDRLSTGQGTAHLSCSDGSTLTLQPQTDIMLTLTPGAPPGGQLVRTVAISRGSVSAQVRSGSAIRTEFSSPAALVAVRGTTLSYSLSEEGYATIQCDDGTLDCSTLQGAASFELSSGESFGVHVSPPPESVVTMVCYTGTIELVVGGVTISIEAGEQVAFTYDPTTGEVQVAAVTGQIDVTSQGITVSVPEGLGTTVASGQAPGQPGPASIAPGFTFQPTAAGPLGRIGTPPPPPPPPPRPPQGVVSPAQ